MPPRTAATATGQPPRYDVVVAGASSAVAPSPGAPAAAATSNTPASTARGPQGDESPSFRLDAREDDPGDRDLVGRKPRIRDLIEQRLEIEDAPSYGDRFDWCRDEYGARYQFSRRYQKTAILIDLFGSDNDSVRNEVARKRTAIEAHNASAAVAIEALMESSDNQAAFDAGMQYMRERGEAPFGYLPMIGIPRDLDLAALKNGAVLDLPARSRDESFVPAGRGVAFR